MRKCTRCGSDAQFGYKKNKESEALAYCHECFEIDYPKQNEEYDPVEVKNMALKIMAERLKTQ